MSLPWRPRGRQTKEMSARYQADLKAFCDRILKIVSGLDFRVSSRGWGYILENEGDITKGDLDAAEKLINDCRKSGDLRSTSVLSTRSGAPTGSTSISTTPMSRRRRRRSTSAPRRTSTTVTRVTGRLASGMTRNTTSSWSSRR
jgi:hypothetical protein